MPFWQPHARSLESLARRYRLGQGRFREMWTGLTPVVIADRHWQTDDLNIFGMLAQAVKVTGTNQQTVSLTAGNVDCLVHRVEFWIAGVNSTNERSYHIFTPEDSYNEFSGAGPTLFLPWCQTRRKLGDTLHTSASVGLTGESTALQTIIVNGVPIVTIGPTLTRDVDVLLGGVIATRKPVRFWDYQDPPLRLKPFQRLTVQETVGAAPATHILNVNFWWSEREPQGDVG